MKRRDKTCHGCNREIGRDPANGFICLIIIGGFKRSFCRDCGGQWDPDRCGAWAPDQTYRRAHRCEMKMGVVDGFCTHHRGYRRIGRRAQGQAVLA